MDKENALKMTIFEENYLQMSWNMIEKTTRNMQKGRRNFEDVEEKLQNLFERS